MFLRARTLLQRCPSLKTAKIPAAAKHLPPHVREKLEKPTKQGLEDDFGELDSAGADRKSEKMNYTMDDIRAKDDAFFLREHQKKRGVAFREEYESLERRQVMGVQQAREAQKAEPKSSFPIPPKNSPTTRRGTVLKSKKGPVVASLADSKSLFAKHKTLPWRVKRTVNGNLPVFQVFRRGGVEAFSVIKGIEGSSEPLRRACMKVCEAPVRVRTGAVEIKGLHTWKLKEWLTTLGF